MICYSIDLCCSLSVCCVSLFFFTDTAPTDIYTLSLHDALPISLEAVCQSYFDYLFYITYHCQNSRHRNCAWWRSKLDRSEEHTSELQSRGHLVCRLLLEKKKNDVIPQPYTSIVQDV